MSWKLGPDSFSKCIVYFTDGNSRSFYSLDWRHRYSASRDKELGLHRLRKLIQKYGSLARTAIIYDKASGMEIEKYNEGILNTEPNENTQRTY
jgi:hypothetical protein